MNKNIIKLPKFKVEKMVSALSETVDWGLIANGVPLTWEKTMGEGEVVFILDTAGATDHCDLIENLAGGINFSSSRTMEDKNGHGTHCAGIIAAAKNDMGIIGVAPKAKIFLVKILNDNGTGSISYIEKGLRFCYESLKSEIKPTVISMSLGSDAPMGREAYKWIKKLYEANIPIVCAAGNSGREGINYPAKYEECIAVGAYNEDGELADFSTTGDEISFAAPGVNIYSTWLNGSYAKLSGTSMATPFLAGIIANLLSKHRKQEALTGKNDCKTVSQIREHLIKHSIDKGQIGKDKQWGYGVVSFQDLINEED